MIIYIFQEREIKGKKIDRLMQKKERLKESAKTAAEGGEEEGGGERPKVKVDEQIEQLRFWLIHHHLALAHDDNPLTQLLGHI